MSYRDAGNDQRRACRQPAKNEPPRLLTFQLPHLLGALFDVQQEQIPFRALLLFV